MKPKFALMRVVPASEPVSPGHLWDVEVSTDDGETWSRLVTTEIAVSTSVDAAPEITIATFAMGERTPPHRRYVAFHATRPA